MGDSEAVVAESLKSYTSTGYADASSDPVPGAGVVGSESNEEAVASSAAMVNSTYGDGYANIGDSNAYGTDPNSFVQEVEVNATYETTPADGVTDTNDAVGGLGSTAMDSSIGTAYNSSVNGSLVGEVANATGVENGNALENLDGSTDEKQLADGFMISMSAEEERLWNIVRANSVDFNAWTALIEETEKVAEDNILKIRKVYDAFLAEFPLCYGYWKKYADHEARLGSIDKVVEVYERAAQGVTYSVDIWLHYCIFAISTYGDPDIVRRMPATVMPSIYGGKICWDCMSEMHSFLMCEP